MKDERALEISAVSFTSIYLPQRCWYLTTVLGSAVYRHTHSPVPAEVLGILYLPLPPSRALGLVGKLDLSLNPSKEI